MTPATFTTIILGVSGALLVGMAGLIKTMVISRLDEIVRSLDELKTGHHQLEIRVARLEAEHRVRSCRYNAGSEDE